MTIDEIRWMSELFKTKKMSKAAEILYVSQPALSQCLQRVEAQLDMKLFERSNKGLEPTEKGLLFYQAATEIINCYDNFLVQTALLDKTELKSIAIGMGPYLSMQCSTEVMLALKKAYPDIHFSVYEAYTPELIQTLHENTIQMVITRESNLFGNAKAYTFGHIDAAIFLRNNSGLQKYAYTENGKSYLDPIYLMHEPIGMLKMGQSSRKMAEDIFKECGIQPNIKHETRHINTLYKFAQEGIASSVSSALSTLLEKDAKEHLIYYIPPKYKHAQSRWAIYVMPEIDRLTSARIYQIIEDVVISALL